jgi:uncharacterized membrane-anchored protein
MKTQIVRDIPIGVLFFVIYLWCYNIVQYLAGWPGFWKGMGVFLISVIGWRFLNIAFDVIKGIPIASKDDKE